MRTWLLALAACSAPQARPEPAREDTGVAATPKILRATLLDPTTGVALVDGDPVVVIPPAIGRHAELELGLRVAGSWGAVTLEPRVTQLSDGTLLAAPTASYQLASTDEECVWLLDRYDLSLSEVRPHLIGGKGDALEIDLAVTDLTDGAQDEISVEVVETPAEP